MRDDLNCQWYLVHSPEGCDCPWIITTTETNGYIVAELYDKALAQHIVELHNGWFEKQQIHKQFTEALENFGAALVELANYLPKKKMEK